VNVETKEQSKQWMHTYSPKKLKQTLSARKLMAAVFWHRRSTDGEIHATRNRNNLRSVLRNTKKLRRNIQNKIHGMLTGGVVLLHDNARPHTAARTRALLEHLNWELTTLLTALTLLRANNTRSPT
jgi:hypothetical protein